MTFDWKDFFFRIYLKIFFSAKFTREKSLRHQQKILKKILRKLSTSDLGKNLDFGSVRSYKDFTATVPITQYDYYEPYIELIKSGKKNVMTDEPVKWLAKTAGTTGGKSKLVPITSEIMRQCHVRGSFFALAKIHEQDKSLRLLAHKSLLIPGGIYESFSSDVSIGDISGILVRSVPFIYRAYYVPSIDIQTHSHWEEKIERAAAQIAKEDVGTISGVPTWILSLLQKLKADANFSKLTDIWPNLQVYFHGGVSFEPYRKQFEELISKVDFNFYEIYNATEGFFGIQESLKSSNLILLTDNFIFYEFIPLDEYYAGSRKAIELSQVKVEIPYVMLVTAPNGLIRYLIGDVVTFQSINPFTFKITGRTQEYINAFGEDLLLSHVENALVKTNEHMSCSVVDYTVAPYYINLHEKGRIQFAIEFAHVPEDLKAYAAKLDSYLKEENSNYHQKRMNDLALSSLEILSLPKGTFYNWLSSKGKLGGQNKVPRLVNDRNVIEEILEIKSSA